MVTGNIYTHLQLLKKQQHCGFAVLADPDKIANDDVEYLARMCNDARVDYLFVGGSLLLNRDMDSYIKRFKSSSNIPVVLFPGSPSQVTPFADGLLYLSLISGRNADLLIGQHVISAPAVKASGLEVISTGYILVDGGAQTTVSYMSNTMPIPADKPEIALCTAWAGEMQGKHVIYLDAGSGAKRPVPLDMIERVSTNISIPLFVGGGLDTPEKAQQCAKAGANLIVVGNAIEKNASLILEMAQALREVNAVFRKNE